MTLGQTRRLTRRLLVLGATGWVGTRATGPRGVHAAPPRSVVLNAPAPVRDPQSYAAYVSAASKDGQFFHYTCEFDAAWAVLQTFGVEASLDEQVAAIGLDRRIEPYYQETADGVLIYGGDIARAFSGDYTQNFLARSRGTAMRKVFAHFGMDVDTVTDGAGIKRWLRRGALIWIKTTVDFKDGVPATWVTPEGDTFSVVLGDHAVVVMGYDDDVVVIRDVLGPTSSNWERPYEYEVDWETFLACWGAQGSDGLAVAPRRRRLTRRLDWGRFGRSASRNGPVC